MHEEKIIKLDEIINDIANNDPELYSRLVDRLNNNIYTILREEKRKICLDRGYHTFSNWCELEGERPQRIIDGDINYYSYGTYYQRECEYCGEIEKAYSIESKNILTKRNNENKKYFIKLNK